MHKMNLQLFGDLNATTSPGLSDEVKTYYEKRLIDNAEPNLVHDQFADKYPIPQGGGKAIEFRRYSTLEKALNPLTEGVTPKGTRLSVTAVNATVNQYGDYIQLSDMLEMTAIDRNVEQATRLLGSSAGRTLDTITREELSGGTQVIYAPKADGTQVLSRGDIDETCALTPDLVFRAAAQLKSMNANPIDDCYVAIIHPYVAYDLMRNPEWLDAHKYADAKAVYMGEIGKLGQVRFVETTEAKIWGPEEIVPGIARMEVGQAIGAGGSAEVVPACEISTAAAQEANARLAEGKNIELYVGGVAAQLQSVTPGPVGSAKLTLKDPVANIPLGSMVCGAGGGKDGSAVFSTLILGASAYGTTEVEGGGLQHIVKQLGYGDDPLNQRSSVGWKATKAAKRLVEAYMLRVESGSAFSAKALSN